MLTLPPTAHEGRRSEWETAQQVRSSGSANRTADASNRSPGARNRTRREHESFLKAAESTGGAAQGGTPPRIHDDCAGCGERRDIDGETYLCNDCRNEAAA
jgi:hypothetical protein